LKRACTWRLFFTFFLKKVIFYRLKITTEVIISRKRYSTFLGINRPTFSEIGIKIRASRASYSFFERHRHGLNLWSINSRGDSSPVWRLIPVDVVVERTRPPLEVLHQNDLRVWRCLSPSWIIPPLLPPLSPSSKETQTDQPLKTSRGTQNQPEYYDKSTVTGETTQGESYTPPESPPRYIPPGSSPFRLTKTTPRLFWRERI